MSTTNPVFQVLVTSGNQAPLAAGNPISSLAVGQAGVFNYHTGLSVGTASAVADCQDIFVAVGLNTTGAGGGATLEDINKSAGQLIQAPNVKNYGNRCYTAPLPMIVDIGGWASKCESEYGIKLEFRNSHIYALYGFNQFTKSFFVKTGCCPDSCSPCDSGDCNDIARGLADQINAEPDHMVSASYVVNAITATINGAPTADANTVVTIGSTTYTVAVLDADTTAQAAQKIVDAINNTTDSPYRATLSGSTITVYPKSTINGSTATFAVSGAGVTANAITAATKTTIADNTALAAFLVTNPGVCVGVRLTTNTEAIYPYNGNINLKYFKLRGTEMIVSLVEGFTCSGSTSALTIQQLTYEEGSGYDIQQLEYEAGGWNGRPGPYRVSALNGVELPGIVYYSSKTAKYSLTTLGYDLWSQSNFAKYQANLQTIIAIPCADTTTLTGLIAIFDHIFTQFAANAGNAALCDCTGDEGTDEYAVANNGIKTLA